MNMVTKMKSNKLSKKFCAYSAAAAVASLAGGAEAAPVIYDTESTPIDVHSSFNTLPNGQNMAAIDPTTLAASASNASTTPTAAGLLGAATGASDNSGVTNGQLAGTVYFRYEIFSEPSASWGKSGTQFGILTGSGNGLYAESEGQSTRPGSDIVGDYGFVEGDVIGDGDNLISTETTGSDTIMQAYSMGPGAAVQADIDGFGAFATGSSYQVVSGVKYLGFQLDNRNGFVKMSPFNGQRNHLQILGWGLESDPFVPITATLVSGGGGGGGGAVPEPATMALLAIGGVGLVALRRRRNK
jgi:hypothetical protein